MAKQLLTPLRLIARMYFSLKNFSFGLFNLTGTVGKVELISTFKHGLHIVITVAEHACDDASKRILKLSIYPVNISCETSIHVFIATIMETKQYLDSLKSMFTNKYLGTLRLI